ncbi:serine hydrolase domain-containing protein [Virgibacillus sp. MG-45]|uniref:serine hydrolase domain-containing protein n=1 Tax=Virgibacillus sp. MG-45 TaxID=3102791 RepID=UPI002ED9FFE4
MYKKFLSIISSLLLLIIIIPNDALGFNQTYETNQREIVVPSKKTTQYPFPWDKPGRLSPVLHPGSASGAGMREEPLQEIDSVMEGMIENGTMPGAVTLVARRGHIVQHKAYGHSYLYKDDRFTEAEEPIQMKRDTIFDLASISKIFTTTAAMKLYEEGLYDLDDPVAAYLPEFAHNGKEEVTIRQLMTHTSGFAPSAPVYDVEGDRETKLQYVLRYPLANTPGTTYTYSDLNMITLGVLIERLSGLRQDEYVKGAIIEPLGMTDTMYNPPAYLKERIAATEFQPWTGRGIVWGTVHDEKAWALEGVAGHAGVFSTAYDLAKLAHMYVNKGSYGGKQILKPSTIELLTENQLPNFPGDDHGLGWELNQMWYMDGLTDKATMGHTGYTGTSIVVSPNNGTIAILLTNRVHPTRNTVSTNPARRQLAQQVADAIPVAMPSKKTKAWFSGYGSNIDHQLTTTVSLKKDALLSFQAWYRTEENADIGYVEVSNDGDHWSTVLTYTGNSRDWETDHVVIPKDTTHIRIRYQTDTYYNGRGIYITNTSLSYASGLKEWIQWNADGWIERNY